MVLRVALLVAVALTLAVAVWWTAWRGTGTQGPQTEAPRPLQPAVETATPGAASGGDAVSASVPTLWRAIDERTVDVKPAFTDGWSQAGRLLVDVTSAAAEARTWQVGDPVGIDIPQIGARYEATIDRIDAGPGYASAARGLATDADGRKRRFVVTVGPGRVFAYVDTPAGPYELIGSDRLGWLLPSSSMMAGIDFSKPDYILPGESRGRFDAEGEAR